MPELPDVEIQRLFLDRHALGRRVGGVDVETAKALEGVSGAELHRELVGHSFRGTRRIGKYLFVDVDDEPEPWNGRKVVLHFGMTGYLAFREGSQVYQVGGAERGQHEQRYEGELPEKTRVRFDFQNGTGLAFVNVRLLGRVFLIVDIDAFRRYHDIGPDALDLTVDEFLEITSGRGNAKSTLMNQAKIAGLGNVYTDEILYQAGIHPNRALSSLSREQRLALYDVMHRVMEVAIDRDADPQRFPDSFLTRHRPSGTGARGEAEEAPTVNGHRIERTSAAGRGCYYVPDRQPSPE